MDLLALGRRISDYAKIFNSVPCTREIIWYRSKGQWPKIELCGTPTLMKQQVRLITLFKNSLFLMQIIFEQYLKALEEGTKVRKFVNTVELTAPKALSSSRGIPMNRFT